MLKKITFIFLALLPVALITSMAAMEFVSWSLFLIFLSHVAFDVNAKGFRPTFSGLKLGIDWALWGYFWVVVLGAIVVVPSGSDKVEAIGEARWIFLLYAYTYLLRIYFKPSWSRYVPVFAVVVSIVGILSLLQFFFGVDITRKRSLLLQVGDFYRASGFFNLPLTFAYSIGMASFVIFGLSLVQIRDNKQPRPTLGFVSSFIGFLGVIVSLTRGAWLSAASGFLVLFYRLKKSWALICFIALTAVVIGMYFTNDALKDRLQSFTTISGNESNRLRTVLWQGHWAIFKDHPVLGVGLGENPKYLLEYYPKIGLGAETFTSHAHNNILQMLAGTGVVGAFFFLSFCIYFLLLAYRLYQQIPADQTFYRGLALGILAAQVHLHVGGLTECNFTDGEVNHQLMLLWAILITLNTKNLNSSRVS